MVTRGTAAAALGVLLAWASVCGALHDMQRRECAR